MEQTFWQEKWQANELGFHQDNFHPLLEKHLTALSLDEQSRVFVPLCGKSKDMLYLQQAGHQVLGLELSGIAVASFFEENHLQVSEDSVGQYQRSRAGDIEILCGDFFQLSRADTGNFQAVFDRAALIAMPIPLRDRYVEKMREICSPGTRILLVTLEYEEGMINPPPFCVMEEEVNRRYGGWCELNRIDRIASEVKGKSCFESAYLIEVKS